MMDEIDFWYLISQAEGQAEAESGSGSILIADQISAIRTALSKMEADDLTGFQEMVDGLMNGAYGYDLWGAAYIITGGLSPDDFEAFRARLILAGRQIFERAVDDPDSLAELDIDLTGEMEEARDLLFIALETYEEVSGDGAIYERPGHSEMIAPYGDNFDETDTEYFKQRYPQLWEKYCRED